MTSLVETFSLGSFRCPTTCQEEHPHERRCAAQTKTVHIEVQEEKTARIYRYQKGGVVTEDPLTVPAAFLDACKKTHPSGNFITPAFIPSRVHSFEESVSDFFFPLARRALTNFPDDRDLFASSAVLDIIFLPIRALTLLPRLIYDIFFEKVHPLQQFLQKQKWDEDEVLVDWHSKYTIRVYDSAQERNFLNEQTIIRIHQWRVDIYPSLDSKFTTLKGERYNADCIDGRVICSEPVGTQKVIRELPLNLPFGTARFKTVQLKQRDQSLYECLEKIIVPPEVSYL